MATFNNTMIFNEPAIGSPAASWGSNIFVVHNDASLADTRWNEPHVLVAAYTDGQGLTETNTQEIIVPAGLSLELFLTSDTAADHTVVCGVYGKVPTKEGVTGIDRKWPGDVDSTNYTNPTDMWIPLQNLEAVWTAKDIPTESTDQTGTVQLQMDNVRTAIKFNGANPWFMGHRTSVYLAGCTSICVSVKNADSVSQGLILGRFVG
jgi:hypothetical protein